MPVVSDKRQIEFLNLIAERKFWCHTGRFDMAFYRALCRALCRSLCRALLPGALSGSMPAAVSSASNMIDNYEFDSHYVVLWRHTLLNEPSSCLKGALESLNLSNEKLMKYELMKYLSEREKTAGSQHHYMFTRKANFSLLRNDIGFVVFNILIHFALPATAEFRCPCGSSQRVISCESSTLLAARVLRIFICLHLRFFNEDSSSVFTSD